MSINFVRERLHSLIAFGNLLHNLGPQNFIDCWHKVNLYPVEICRLLLLVDIRLDFNSNKFCNATGLLFFSFIHEYSYFNLINLFDS